MCAQQVGPSSTLSGPQGAMAATAASCSPRGPTPPPNPRTGGSLDPARAHSASHPFHSARQRRKQSPALYGPLSLSTICSVSHLSKQILSWDVIRILPSSQERLSCLGNMPGSAGHPGMLHLSVPPPRPHLATAARKAPHPVRQKNEWKGGRRWVSLGGGSIRVTWEGTGPPSTLTQPSPAHRLPQTNCKLWPWSASSFCRCRKQGSARAVSVWPGAAQ